MRGAFSSVDRRLLGLTLFSGFLLLASLLAPFAEASGSGYNLSYTRAAGSTSLPAVDLVRASSSDSGGSNLTITFAVSGNLVLSDSTYLYFVWLGGSSNYNATGWVEFSNNSTVGIFSSSSGSSYSSGFIHYTVSGGSSLSFSIAKGAGPPASSFGVNVEALHGTPSSGQWSWLGTNYAGTGGGGTCTSAGCTTNTPAASSSISGALLYGIVGAVVAVVVVVAAVVLLMRRKKMPPPMVPPTPPGFPSSYPLPPPGPPSSYPPPPPGSS